MTLKKTIIATSIATSILGLLSQSVMAQDSLQTTVVKSEEEIKTTANVKVINSEQIDNEMITDIFDTIRYTPGVSVSNTGNRFGDNGFNIRGMESDAVAITVDGLSQGESLSPITFSRYGMYSSTRNAVEIESVKSVQILKGANSILAGSGALGGAVMYTTKDAKDFLPAKGDAVGGKIKFGYDGRNEEKLSSFAFANRLGGLEALAIYTLRDSNETSAHDNGADIEGPERGQADPYDRETENLLLKVSYNFSEQHELGLVYENYNNETLGTPLSRQSATYYDFNTNDESNRERIGVFYNWQANNAVFDSLELKLNKQEIYTTGVTAFSYASAGSEYLRVEDRNFNQEHTNLTVDFTKVINTDNASHDIVYGFIAQTGEVENNLQDIRYNGLTSDTGLRNGYPIIDPSWVPQTETDTWTVYIRDAVKLNDQLTISAGLRYDNTSYSPKTGDTFVDNEDALQDSEFSAITGQVTASYELMPNHTLIGSIGTGFKAPTTQELYLNTNGTSEFIDSVRNVDPDTGSVFYTPTGRTEADLDTVTNPDLEAEEGINYELAYQWVGETASIKVSAFRSDYSNMILNINQSRTIDTPLTSASLNTRQQGCTQAVIGDDCWTVAQITEDTWGVPTNTGKVKVTGFEVEAAWHITQQLTASLAYSHTSGEYDNAVNGSNESNDDGSFAKGDPLESMAPDSTVLGLNYYSEDKNWGTSAYVRLIDDTDEEESFSAIYYNDSATVVDLSAWYDITESLSLHANVTNLFNEEYSSWSRLRHLREGTGGFFGGVAGDGVDRYSEPGRKFAVNISYAF